MHSIRPTILACLLLACLLLFDANAAISSQPQTPPIIPAPAHASIGQGSLNLSHGLFFDSSTPDANATSVVAYLKGLLETTHCPRIVDVAGPSAPTLLFAHRAAHSVSGAGEDESYHLSLSPKEIRITASSRTGYLYGAISLWQLLSQKDDPILAWDIEDAPRFRWRGIMLDSSRHMQSEAFILQLLDYMAEHKLNVFHWHLTDDQGWRLEIKRYPRLTSIGAYRPQTMPPYQPRSGVPTGPYGGFYTQEQVRCIVAYAKARNITVVPEIEMPGHATAAIVAYPEFGSAPSPLREMPVGWGIFPNLYSPSDPTLEFLQNILLEVMDLFPSQYIHVGGDEAVKDQWKSNPAIQQKIHALGLKDEDALQAWFMKQMDTFLNSHGRRMIGWDEILEGGLSQNATVMSWRGMQGGIAAAKLGHDAVLSPTRPLYFNYRQSSAADEPPGRDPVNSLEDVYHFQANPTQLSPSEQAHILGVQGNLWTEYILTPDRLQHMLFPRAAALAELAWSPDEARNFPDFLRRLPTDNQRTQDAGIHPAHSVFNVTANVQPSQDGAHATVALSTQAATGETHYTLDSSPVRADSPLYTAPLQITFPLTLHAANFAASTQTGDPLTQPLTLAATLARDSRVLDACNGDAGIQLEQDPPRSPQQPVFRVVFYRPCWIYRGAQMDHFNRLSVSVGSIPYIFRSADHPMPQPSTAAVTSARIAIHLDTCQGSQLASIPLQPAFRKDGAVHLPAVSLPPQQGAHDLCFEVEDADPATVWLLHTIQPIPNT